VGGTKGGEIRSSTGAEEEEGETRTGEEGEDIFAHACGRYTSNPGAVCDTDPWVLCQGLKKKGTEQRGVHRRE